MEIFTALKTGCLNLIFPPVCGACGMRMHIGKKAGLCPDCASKVRFLCEPLCPVCGMEQQGVAGSLGHLCGTCLSNPPSYELARSLVRYETVVRQLIHRLKYGGNSFVAGALGELISNCDLSLFAECRVIIPVPLHLQRLRLRGLNQAMVLARLLFPGREQAIIPDGLFRIRNTVAQTELRGIDRRKNLKNSFQLNRSFDPDQLIVCLIDDVFTTGTTVEECSMVLKGHGAKEVRVLTLARASRNSMLG